MLDILFRDARFVIVDKPSGLPVHPSRSRQTSVEDIFPELSRRHAGPWLAHRLDMDTAGCLLIALRRAALLEAQACFAEGRVEKVYWAVVEGVPKHLNGVLDTALTRQSHNNGWHMAVTSGGQRALTNWRLCGTTGQLSWLELQPQTGRTHQVRVHCAALGCPVVGDVIYGRGGGPLQLLARSIRLPLKPETGATAPVPPHMASYLTQCGWRDNVA